MLVFSVHFGIMGSESMKNKLLILMLACFSLAMMQPAYADEVTQEQIEEVMKKGFKAKLHNDLAANKEVLAKYAKWLAAYKPPKGDAESWKKKTGEIATAIKLNDQARLKKAVNCKACHNAHK
jgi:cytochrome c